MNTALFLLLVVAALIQLACFAITWRRLMAKEDRLLAVVGLVAGAYTFWWGWKNIVDRRDHAVMITWTTSFVLSLLLGILRQSAS